MVRLDQIEGQERAVSRLKAALATARTHHAYLFEGPEGVGKRTTALAMAAAWNCESRPGVGCEKCTSCRKISEGIHPDVLPLAVFNEEGKVKDQTDRVRELIGALGFPPHEGRARVVLIDPADELNATASNVLLKTLEEPPAGTHFILLTSAASRMLLTIRSRCLRVSFGALTDEVVGRRLVAEGIDADTARSVAGLAGGSLSRALALASSDELPKRKERVARFLGAARDAKIPTLLDAAGELSGDREEALATLELLWVVYHDALVAVAELAPEGNAEASRLRARVDTSGLLRGIRTVEEAADAIRGYVSPQLALERLLLRLGEARGA